MRNRTRSYAWPIGLRLPDGSDRPGDIRDAKGVDLSTDGSGYTPEQSERLRKIHSRLVEARRELDALIGDAYLRPRASVVPVHFLDLASAAEKLRWAEKEWRELDQELSADAVADSSEEEDSEDEESHEVLETSGARS